MICRQIMLRAHPASFYTLTSGTFRGILLARDPPNLRGTGKREAGISPARNVTLGKEDAAASFAGFSSVCNCSVRMRNEIGGGLARPNQYGAHRRVRCVHCVAVHVHVAGRADRGARKPLPQARRRGGASREIEATDGTSTAPKAAGNASGHHAQEHWARGTHPLHEGCGDSALKHGSSD